MTSNDSKVSVRIFFFDTTYIQGLMKCWVFLQVVFKMNYIPHETLRALLGVLKQSWAGTLAGGVVGIEFGVVALKSFHR